MFAHAKLVFLGLSAIAGLAGYEVYKKMTYPYGGITPPGDVLDPDDPVDLPAAPSSTDPTQQTALQTAAAALVQSLNTGGLNTSSTPACLAFQQAWNASGGLTLQTDGIYG